MLNLHQPIYYYSYVLRAKRPLSSLIQRVEIEGALVKIGNGMGCLQPWPELGDLPLARQLKILEKGGLTSHLERLRICCLIDGAARKANHSAFAELEIPPSHWLEPGPGRIVKLKCSPDIRTEAARLKDIEAAKLRLDFNRALTIAQFREFVRLLDDSTLRRIDFVEDPFAAHQSEWDKVQEQIPFDLAADRQPVRSRVNVVKPACDMIKPTNQRVVFTSYMDHPIGQFFAAREAAAFYASNPHQREACGLCTHTLFESDDFIDRVQLDDANRLVPPEGTGLGFDDLLEKLAWKKLV
jgi:O-succinylbenzoate synthase